jgi:four helix bundle protein
VKNFKQLRIWKKGFDISISVFKIGELIPQQDRFLRSQMIRSAISIASNIAEGSSRKSEKEYFRFLEIALGSAFELETQLLLAIEMYSHLTLLCSEILASVREEQMMISTLMNHLTV